MAKDSEGERIVSKQTFLNLLKAASATESEMAGLRGDFGSKLAKAEKNQYLDVTAFRMARSLAKKDKRKAEFLWRNLKIYVEEFLEIGLQADIEDAPKSKRAEPGDEFKRQRDAQREGDAEEFEGAANGHDPVDDVMRAAGGAALNRFREALSVASNHKAVEKGLARFLRDNPALEEMARAAARQRLTELDVEAGTDKPEAEAEALLKGHSIKSNARRAARRFGVLDPDIYENGGLFFWRRQGAAKGGERPPEGAPLH
jgi:hypothetical protein